VQSSTPLGPDQVNVYLFLFIYLPIASVVPWIAFSVPEFDHTRPVSKLSPSSLQSKCIIIINEPIGG
jgi:hypothetical protein